MDLRHEIRTTNRIHSQPYKPGAFEEILEEARRIGYRSENIIYARITHKKDKPYECPALLLQREGETAIITDKDMKVTLYSCRDLGETRVKDLSSEVEEN